MFAMINDLPNNNLLTIHNQETAAENEFFEKGTIILFEVTETSFNTIVSFWPNIASGQKNKLNKILNINLIAKFLINLKPRLRPIQ